MKKIPITQRDILLSVISAVPSILDTVFYRYGSMGYVYWFLPVFIGLTVLNYLSLEKVSLFLAVQSFIFVCNVASQALSTYLYYHNVSSDAMTPAVGFYIAICSSGIIAAVTAIAALCKRSVK